MQEHITQKTKSFSRIPDFSLIFFAFILGAVAVSVFWYFHNQNVVKALSQQIKPLRQSNNPYKFINPLLGYDVPGDVKEFNEYQPLKKAVTSAVSGEGSSAPDGYSVYFRDLTLGRWVGVNENIGYAPASMMKVAIMIAYFKEAEADPSVLKQSFAYSTSTADAINGVPFETPSDLQVGKNYSVEQLIQAMIISSDNGAKNVLLENINQPDLDEIYTDLGLPNPDNSDNYIISPKQYSLLLRVLYNATYLSRTYSEEALQILSEAKYSQGLLAGLPKGTIAAQKFGENVDGSASQDPEITLSNCGVIYHPTHPYILCVMSKGKNLDNLASTIADISNTVWNSVNSYATEQNY